MSNEAQGDTALVKARDEMVLLTEKCTERTCGTRVRYSELTDEANTHWHVRRGIAFVPLDALLSDAHPGDDEGEARAWNPNVGPHTRAVESGGNPYCVECSRAIQQWVAYPCRDWVSALDDPRASRAAGGEQHG